MRRTLFIAASLVLACLVATETIASMADFDLSWHVIAGGGGQSVSSSYIVSGTVGQAHTGALAGGPYTLSGGFWSGGVGVAVAGYRVYLPSLLRNR
nr:hypothetical protein [Chloroflexota bacterium]